MKLTVPLLTLAVLVACQPRLEMQGITTVCVGEPFHNWAVGKAKRCVFGGNGRHVGAALLCDDTSIEDADRAYELGDNDTNHAEVALLGDKMEYGAWFDCVRQYGQWQGSPALVCKRK
jgi:hypothetical protein